MPDARSLDEVLADARDEVDTLRRNGAGLAPARAVDILDDIAKATEEFRRMIPEQEAMLRSGRSQAWLRAQFPALESQGHAQLRHGKRYYRALVIPRRGDAVSARMAGLRGERRVG